MIFKIGTRGSKLALTQAGIVKEELEKHHPDHTFVLEVIKTTGDKFTQIPIRNAGEGGIFVKELEEKLLDGSIDIAVHSTKDLPAEQPEGLSVTTVLKREDPRDVLVLSSASSISDLKENAVIGTGSLRRKYQLLKLRPDLQIVDIRGNVETRIKKMQEQKLDGIVLAAAGIKRLGLEEHITQYLSYDEMIPAPAQGALAVEMKADRRDIMDLIMPIKDDVTDMAVNAEREFLARMGVGCHQPVGAICTVEDDILHLNVMYSDEEGCDIRMAEVTGEDPVLLGKQAEEKIRGRQ